MVEKDMLQGNVKVFFLSWVMVTHFLDFSLNISHESLPSPPYFVRVSIIHSHSIVLFFFHSSWVHFVFLD